MEVRVPEQALVDPAHRSGPRDGPDPGVAALLAQTLGDGDWWLRFASCPDDEDWRDAMAREALDLYRRTAPFVRPTAGVTGRSEPIDKAVAVLREIADACALQSYRWTWDERMTLRIPTHAALVSSARLSGVDAWVRGLGYALELGTPGASAEAWPIAPADSEAGAPHDLAARFCEAALLYEVVVRARAVPNGWHVLRADVFRRGACQEVGVARGWLLWTTGYLEAEALPVAHAMLLMAQMFFVASRDEAFAEELFPSEAFLREFLAATGALAWLSDQGAHVPDWLA
jgi:hypothetical protein